MLPASFIQMKRFWHNIAIYVITLCVDHFTYQLGAGGLGHTQNGIC